MDADAIPEAFWAPIICEDILDDIVCEAVAEVYDKELAAREVQFAIDRCIEEAILQTNAKVPVLDVLLDQNRPEEYRFQHRQPEELELLANAGSWDPEEEPPTVPVDSWASAVVPVRVRARPPKRDEETLAKRAAAAQAAKAGGPQSPKPGKNGNSTQAAAGAKNEGDTSTTAAVVPGLRRTATRRMSTSSARSGTASVFGGGAKSVVSTSGSATGTVVSRAQPMDDSKKAALVVKALKGKTLTYDDRGNPVIVNPLPANALPPSTLPVTVQIEPPPKASPSKSMRSPGGKGGRRGSNGGGGVTFGGDAFAVASSGNHTSNGQHHGGGSSSNARSVSGNGRGRSPSGRMGSKKGLGSSGGGMRSPSAGSIGGSSASSGSPLRAQYVLPKREVEKHFRPQPGGQPPLPDALEQSGLLSPGVTVSQGKRNAMASKPKIAGSAPSSPNKAGGATSGPGGATVVQRMGATMTKQEFDRTLASGVEPAPQQEGADATQQGQGLPRVPSMMRRSNNAAGGPGGVANGVSAAEETLRRRAARTNGGGGLRTRTGGYEEPGDEDDDGEQRQYHYQRSSISPLRHSSDSLSAAVAAAGVGGGGGGTGRAGIQTIVGSSGGGGVLQSIPDLTTRPSSGTLRSAAFGTLGTGGAAGGGGGGATLPVGILVPPSPPRNRATMVVPVGEQSFGYGGGNTMRSSATTAMNATGINAPSGPTAFASTNVLNRGLAAAAVAVAAATSHPPQSTIGVGTVVAGATAGPSVVPVGAAGAAASDGESASASGSVKPGSGIDFAAKAAARRAESLRNREYAARAPPGGLNPAAADDYHHSVGGGGSVSSSSSSQQAAAHHPPALASGHAGAKTAGGALPADISKRPRDRASKASGVHSNEHAPAPPFGHVAHYEEGQLQLPGPDRRQGPEDDDMLVIDGSVAGEEPSGELDAETGQLLPSRIRAVADQSITAESPTESPTSGGGAAGRGGGGGHWGRKR